MSKAQKTTYTRNIGQNRGKPRLWLEKAILENSGFPFGTSFDVVNINDCITIEAKTDGHRRVSGAPNRPIIDINSGVILEGFGPVVSLTCVANGFLVIKNAKQGGEK